MIEPTQPLARWTGHAAALERDRGDAKDGGGAVGYPIYSTLPGFMMPFGSTRLLDRAHQLDRDRVLVTQQFLALELADAVLRAEATAVARDQVVHGAIDAAARGA